MDLSEQNRELLECFGIDPDAKIEAGYSLSPDLAYWTQWEKRHGMPYSRVEEAKSIRVALRFSDKRAMFEACRLSPIIHKELGRELLPDADPCWFQFTFFGAVSDSVDFYNRAVAVGALELNTTIRDIEVMKVDYMRWAPNQVDELMAFLTDPNPTSSFWEC